MNVLHTQSPPQVRSDWRFPGCPGPPEWSLEFPALVARFDWLPPLGACPQDPIWHAEGDVLTHTGMVCAELAAMPAWRALPEADRHVVFAAALLHDVAKPRFTKEEDGRIRSRGHTLGGARMARRILAQSEDLGPDGAPFEVREQIVALVRNHGLPPMLLGKPDPERAVIRAAVTARLDLLSVLAEADMRGRSCADRQQGIDRVGLFREFSVECGCGSKPYAFASAHSRFRYFRTPGALPTIEVFDDARLDVTLLSGLPAAGKDTRVRQHVSAQGGEEGEEPPVISLDALRAEMGVGPGQDQGPVLLAAKEQAKSLLRAGTPFVWNATNTTRALRDGLIDLFAAYGARVRIVYCETPWATLRRRNRSRRSPVPDRIIEKLIDHLDLPDESEAHEVEYVLSE